MNTYKENDVIALNDIKAGLKFVGGNGITYTVTDRTIVSFDDAEIQVTYLDITDGVNNYVVDLNEIVKAVA